MSKIGVNLTGKVALITGAGKGIGRAISISFAKAGAKVIAVSRTQKDLEALVEEISKYGKICTYCKCDVRDVAQINRTVEQVIAQEKKIDILVNSAGLNIQAHTLEVTEEQWDTIIDTNMKGSFFMAQAVARRMKDFGEGRIINITSDMALVGFYKRAAYCASKGGLTQAVKAMAIELADYNIKVNCVAPTFIRTALTETMFKDENFYNEVIRRIPLGKLGKPEDVVGAVLFLASDSADMVTGTTIIVDGGWVAL